MATNWFDISPRLPLALEKAEDLYLSDSWEKHFFYWIVSDVIIVGLIEKKNKMSTLSGLLKHLIPLCLSSW